MMEYVYVAREIEAYSSKNLVATLEKEIVAYSSKNTVATLEKKNILVDI